MTRSIVVDPAHLGDIKKDRAKLNAIIEASETFWGFLPYWKFVDQERNEVKSLGDELWPGQEIFVEATETDPFIYALKARKLGYTTLECAYDAWVARFRDMRSRVHLFSRRDDAAIELLKQVKFGLTRLPEWMQLPMTSTTHELWLYGDSGEGQCTGATVNGQFRPCGGSGDSECPRCYGSGVVGDVRLIKSYPTSEQTAVENTANHGHVDEWARMKNPESVWQAIEPSMAGSCHIITTGLGPGNYTAQFWRRSKDGLTGFRALFTPAMARPDRDDAWLAAKRAGMTEKQFRNEYAMTDEDALYGGGSTFFDPADCDHAGAGRGPTPPQEGRVYVQAWDIGRHQDAAVGVVLDVTDPIWDIVSYRRLRGVPYPGIQSMIEHDHRAYSVTVTMIEKNGPGEAVMENLDLPEEEIEGFSTTKPSKARILSKTQLRLEQQTLRWSSVKWPQLDAEMRAYQLPDDAIVQDSVIATAIGVEAGDYAPVRRKGKVRAVIRA